MYRTTLNPYPIRTSRVSAPYSRIASPRTVVGDVDVFRLARDISGDTYRPSTLLSNPSQLVDPELRGGDALFPNLRVGRFGNDALYEDNTVLRVAEMIRPDVIDLTSTNPTRRAKALEDIQFNKAGQSPGQAKALAELIRRKPELASSFNIGYGSSLNKEQGLAQKEGRVFEFDPNDEKWKSGFTRKDPNIVQMNDLQGMLLKNAELDTYQGEPLPPYATKLVYNNADRTQDINDPQLFFNPKSRANIDYQGLADAFESIPKDVTSKTGRSLRDRWDRTKDYKAFPPRGQTLVINPDKRTQTIDEIIDDVNQVEGWYSPKTADKRAVYSRAEGNNDNRNIPTRADYEEWVRGMGDSINLEPDNYNPSNTIIELFGGIAADRDGNTFPLTRLKRKESSVIGREFDESNAKSAFTFPIETKRAYKLLRDGSPVIEDRTFLLNSPTSQAPVRAMASVLPPGYYSQRERDIPTGIRQLDLFNNTDPYLRMAVDENNNPIYRSELPANYYGTQRDIPTTLSAIEEGLTGRKGSIVGYANVQRKQRPTTRLGTQYTESYVNPYRRVLPQGKIELPNGMVVNQVDPIKAPELAGMAWAKESALYPNTSERIKGLDTYYRIAGQDYSLSNRDGSPLSANGDNYTYVKDFKTPEVILPSTLAGKYQPYTGNMGYSPNNYRKAMLGGKDVNDLDITKLSRREAKQLKDIGFYEFNDIMDEGVQISKDLDRLYQLNDLATPSDAVGDIASRANDLIRMRKYTDGIKTVQPIGNIFEYIQPDILDEIVMAERKQQDMGGTYRTLTGSQDQGSFEQERMAYEGRPSALTQYNVNDVLEPSFGGDYSGRANTGRIRVPSGIDYDAGIPIPTSRTRLASGAIDPIKLQDDFVESFNQAQYTRDLIDRGGVLIDTQLGIPILKAPTTSFNPATQRKAIVNVGGAEINTPKNITYLQPVRPSRVANGVANWQAPESLTVGRVGKQIPIQNIPELPTDTGMTVERRASSPMASIQRELMNDNSISLSPWFSAPLPSRDWITTTQGQVLYPNTGIGPINTGLKPKPTIGELFGFTAITPEGLAKYRDMG